MAKSAAVQLVAHMLESPKRHGWRVGNPYQLWCRYDAAVITARECYRHTNFHHFHYIDLHKRMTHDSSITRYNNATQVLPTALAYARVHTHQLSIFLASVYLSNRSLARSSCQLTNSQFSQCDRAVVLGQPVRVLF